MREERTSGKRLEWGKGGSHKEEEEKQQRQQQWEEGLDLRQEEAA